jgi:5-deoxy-glucuronate isomerase
MIQYTSQNLIIQPGGSPDPDVIVEVTPALAGWEHISFQSRRLAAGGAWAFETGPNELALVVLGGSLNVHSNRGEWNGLGQRSSVFSGLPYALFLPAHTKFSVQAVTDCEFAAAWTAADKEYAPRLVRPSDVTVEIRGGDNATRQINRIMPPGFPCSRLVVVEVYTPSGSWSSYPPHKHDVHKVNPDGSLLEADLEEVYYYKIDRPEGYAFQRIYTGADSPLKLAGHPFDCVVMARDNAAVLVPEGYHPVTSAPGYNTYYLNILAGSAQSLAASDDPQYAWVKGTYRSRDPRVPLYDVSAAKALE